MHLSLANKTVLVTGASSGLGSHFAKCAIQAGAKVIVAARRREKLDELIREISALGGMAAAISLDVTDQKSIETALNSIETIDVVVNNAGVAQTSSATEVSLADFDKVVDTNLRGAFIVAKTAATRWIERNQAGVIVNVASILGLRVAGGLVAYTASKAGLIQMTKATALEWARYGIRVNAIAPGYLATQLNEGFFGSTAGDAMMKRVPMRRLGKLSELDGPFLLLASDASSFMTGSVLVVDGGHLVSSL